MPAPRNLPRLAAIAAAVLLAVLAVWAFVPRAPDDVPPSARAPEAATGAAPGAAMAQEAAPDSTPLPDAEAEAAEATGEAPAAADLPEVATMALGPEDAPVTMIEYASFTCPHCATFHDEVWPEIKRDYVDTGRVRFEYREVFFDRPGLWASLVARCGGGMRFFGIADLIYENQGEWTQGEPAEIAANLRRLGLTAGLTEGDLDACLVDGAMAQALVARFEAQTEADGITSTPSFVIDGERHSNMSLPEFRSLLDAELEG